MVSGLALAVLWSVAAAAAISAAAYGRLTLVPAYAAFTLYLVVLSIPVAMLSTSSGVFHPLVFFVLWRGFVKVLRVDALLASGAFTFHRSLPDLGQAALDRIVAKSFVLETLALIGLYAGYSAMRFIRVPRLPVPRAAAVRLKVLAWLTLSAVAILVLARAAGGFGSLLMQRGLPQVERVRQTVGGHWHLLASVGTIAPILWLAFQPRAVRSPFFWVAAPATFALGFIARGSRSTLITTLIVLIVVYALRRHEIPYKTLMAGALSAIVVLGVLGQFRRATQKADTLDEVIVDSGMTEGFSQGVQVLAERGTEGSGPLAVIARVPEKVGYLYGRSYLAIPTIIFPRAIVGEKPPTASKLNAQLVHERQDTNIPPGAVAESFWNFSYAGPLLVYFIFGVILKVIAGMFLVNADNPLVVAAYAHVLVLFVPSSDAVFNFVQAIVAAMFFGMILTLDLGLRRPRRSGAGQHARAGAVS
jgi:hypothetical protein